MNAVVVQQEHLLATCNILDVDLQVIDVGARASIDDHRDRHLPARAALGRPGEARTQPAVGLRRARNSQAQQRYKECGEKIPGKEPGSHQGTSCWAMLPAASTAVMMPFSTDVRTTPLIASEASSPLTS